MFKKTNNVNVAENTNNNKAINGLINCSKNVAIISGLVNAGLIATVTVGGKTGLITTDSAIAEKLAKILGINIFVSAGSSVTYVGGKIVKKITSKKASKEDDLDESIVA